MAFGIDDALLIGGTLLGGILGGGDEPQGPQPYTTEQTQAGLGALDFAYTQGQEFIDQSMADFTDYLEGGTLAFLDWGTNITGQAADQVTAGENKALGYLDQIFNQAKNQIGSAISGGMGNINSILQSGINRLGGFIESGEGATAWLESVMEDSSNPLLTQEHKYTLDANMEAMNQQLAALGIRDSGGGIRAIADTVMQTNMATIQRQQERSMQAALALQGAGVNAAIADANARNAAMAASRGASGVGAGFNEQLAFNAANAAAQIAMGAGTARAGLYEGLRNQGMNFGQGALGMFSNLSNTEMTLGNSNIQGFGTGASNILTHSADPFGGVQGSPTLGGSGFAPGPQYYNYNLPAGDGALDTSTFIPIPNGGSLPYNATVMGQQGYKPVTDENGQIIGYNDYSYGFG